MFLIFKSIKLPPSSRQKKREAEFLEKSINSYYTVRRYVREDTSLQKFFNSENQEPMKMENISLYHYEQNFIQINERVIKKHVKSVKKE